MAMPLVLVRTVGTGKTHATIALWEDATDYDVTAANVIEVGLVYADSVFDEAVNITGATTDPGHFRVLTAAPGHLYDPITNTGVLNARSVASIPFVYNENYFVLRGIGCVPTVAINNPMFAATNIGTYTERCFAKDVLSAVGSAAFHEFASEMFWRRCIAVGKDGTNGLRYGFLTASGISKSLHCVSHLALLGVSPQGWNAGLATGCIGIGNSADFSGVMNVSFANASLDASAPGTGSITGVTAAQAFRNAAANDFRPPAGAPTIDKGVPFVPPFKPLAMALAPGHSLNTGLVLACPFADRVANVSSDISGKANHITLAAGAGDAAWSRHFPGATVSMDGGAAIPMTVAQTSGLPLYTATSSFSVSMWVLTTTIAAGVSPMWVEDSSSTSGWYRLSRSTATLALEILNDAGGNILASTTGGTLVANRLHHIVIVDAGGSVAVYLDRVRVISATYTRVAITDLTLTTPFNALTGTAFTGHCADIRAWSRALTPGEVASLALTNPWGQYGGEPPTDFAGHTIPQGASLDMGAYEAALAGASFAEGSRWAAMGREGRMPSPLLPRGILPPYPSEKKQRR